MDVVFGTSDHSAGQELRPACQSTLSASSSERVAIFLSTTTFIVMEFVIECRWHMNLILRYVVCLLIDTDTSGPQSPQRNRVILLRGRTKSAYNCMLVYFDPQNSHRQAEPQHAIVIVVQRC